MNEPKWPNGDRRPPPGGRADDYRGPDPGTYHRDRGGYPDDFALPRDNRGWYRDEPGERGNDEGVYYGERAGGRGTGRGTGRGATYEDDRDGRAEPPRRSAPAGRGSRRWGTLPARTGVTIVVGSAALGALITAVTGSQPSAVLGVLLVAGTIIATVAVRPKAAYRIIPAPALTYVVAAALAGLVSDRATGTSSTALAINGAQWIAGGFIAMTVATVLAIVISLARLAASHRAQRGTGRARRDPGRGSRASGQDQGNAGRGQRTSGQDQGNAGRGQPASGRDQYDPRRGPGDEASSRRPSRATGSRPAPRRADRDPDYPMTARDSRGGNRRYPDKP